MRMDAVHVNECIHVNKCNKADKYLNPDTTQN